MALGPGLEVAARRGRLTLRGQTPIPAVRRGLRLYPEPDDPYAFRIDLSALGLDPSRVVFGQDADGRVTALHANLMPMSSRKRPDHLNPRRWVTYGLVAGGVVTGVRTIHRWRKA